MSRKPVKYEVPVKLPHNDRLSVVVVEAFSRNGAIREAQRKYNATLAEKCDRRVCIADEEK